MKYISRHMENRIQELSKSYSAILLTGPRQAGKTTMLRELAEKENIGRKYVTLDDLTERDMAKNDPALFLQLHKPPVLIDEVQYAPELFTYIKIHIDEHHNPGDFWMTGSQIFRQCVIVQKLGTAGGNGGDEAIELQHVHVAGEFPHIPLHIGGEIGRIENIPIRRLTADQPRH